MGEARRASASCLCASRVASSCCIARREGSELSIVGWLPLHARVRACGIARWFRRELPRAVELWDRLEFEPCYASERITDRELEGLLRRIGAAQATRRRRAALLPAVRAAAAALGEYRSDMATSVASGW